MKIQTNSSGTRSIEIADQHLQTIEKYQLFRDLIDSNGYVDEQVLDKLKLNIRSLLEGDAGKDKDLLDLCLDVIYHPNMKAYGLQQLVLLFINWKNQSNANLGMTTRAFQGTPFNWWENTDWQIFCRPLKRNWISEDGMRLTSSCSREMPM